MTSLNECLLDYIKHEVEVAVSKSAGSSLRIVFSSPPKNYLSRLFDFITCDGSGLCIETGNSLTTIPTYLLDNDVADPQKKQLVARCTPTYLTTIRNLDYPIWIVLQEVSAKANRSLETTSVPIGIYKEVRDFSDWLTAPIVEYLIDKIFAKFKLNKKNEKYNNVVEFALGKLWEVDEGRKEKSCLWNLFDELLSSNLEGGDESDVLLAKVGLPYCQMSELGSNAHLSILDRMSELFQTKGLRGGFEELENNAEEGKLPYVKKMRAHIECKNVIEANDFSRNPLGIYSPVNPETMEIPRWWYELDLETWMQLLDSSDEESTLETAVLEVVLLNQLSSVPKGLVQITADSVQIRTSVVEAEGAVVFFIEKSNGSSAFQKVYSEQVSAESPNLFVDDDIPKHERFIRYRISGEGLKPTIIKVIVLNYYNPGVVALNQGALKATPFKLNRKAVDDKTKNKISRYESDLELSGMGSHILDCYVSSNFEISPSILGYEVDAEQSGPVERKFSRITEFHYSCLIDTDEECYYEFVVRNKETGVENPCRVYISADDAKQEGARSELERLIIMNKASASGVHESPRVDPYPSRVMELEVWVQDNPNSFRPLIFGPDYAGSWRRPDWEFDDPFSSLGMPIDPRPPQVEFNPPQEFVEARAKVIEFLKPSSEQANQPATSLKLYELMRDEKFGFLVMELLDTYLNWLRADYDNAAWSDLVCVHSSQSGSKALESAPYAVLMTPFHPIKLAWQCCAQTVLQEALDKNIRCPAASVMNPATFPDCFVLPCRTATGAVVRKGFVSLASSSDYWGVLLSIESSDLHQITEGTSIFGSDFGISVEGLASGFSSQQVVRSLDEISRLLAAKTTMRVGLSSGSVGSSSCNEGIYNWCSAHLGEDQDDWIEAGPRSLIIDDFRARDLQPEQAELASLTAKSNATVSWFRVEDTPEDYMADLSIIAHLSTMSRDFDKQGIHSAIDASSLVRWRIRKQLPGQNAAFIAESRIGEISRNVDASSLTGKLLGCIHELERQCRNMFDSYIFAPDLANLGSVVQHSRYTALSSGDIDSACFFGSTSKAYLWDYELPSYSKRAGENTGYYLLACESPGILKAVRSALELLGDASEFSDENISTILEEISRRGMPTLKRLTSGGSMSVGELGMLVALRVFQSDFEPDSDIVGLLPSRDEDTLNIIVPADPFQRHYDELRSALKFKYAERPDLIVLSIKFLAGSPVKMRLTPVEVKARTDALSSVKRKEALDQAKHFAYLLEEIHKKSEAATLWGLAWRNLLATMLDYGFRVYGQLDKFMSHSEWAEQHSAILRSIALNELDIEIDKRGRLFIVENSNDNSIHDIDGDGFAETIVLQHKEAFSILSRSDASFTDTINKKLFHWDLKPEINEVHAVVGTNRVDDLPDSTENAEYSSEDLVATVSYEGQTQKESEKNQSEIKKVADEIFEEGLNPGIKFKIGTAIRQFSTEDLYFFPSNTALNQLNVGIVGDLGTGKTQLIQGLVHQLTNDPDMNRGKKPNILIFDYKRDYSKPEFVEATGAKVVSPFDIPLNLFDIRDSSLGRRAWLERSKFFIDVMNKLYSGIGAVQGQNIKDAVKTAYSRFNTESGQSPTINDVFEEYKNVVKSPDTPYSIMSDLVDGEYFVSNNSKVVPFSEFLKGVVVIDLSQIGQDDKTKNMLVVIFLNLFYEHMLKIEKRPFLGENPKLRFVDTMLLVDEADNIMKYEFEVLKKILLQGREFGVGVLLASQYLSHFKTSHENYLEPLLSWFVHKVPNVTVRELEGIGLTRVNPDLVDQIKTLQCHECLFKTFDVDGKIIRGKPFFELNKK
jgi:DNA phosphorothioation-dependent restriction protein DptH